MAAIGKILDRIEDNEKPLVEQIIRQLERHNNVRTVDGLAKLGDKAVESAIKALEGRNPFFELDDKDRGSLAQKILKAAKETAEEERKREETRRARPAVALDDLSKAVNVPAEVRDAWKAAGINSTGDLLAPAAAKVLLDKNVPLSKRRELIAVSKLALGSRNLKLSESLYKEGVTSLTRLARMPKRRLDAILNKAKLGEDSRRDAFELQRRARLMHRQTQALAVRRGSARHNFGPPLAPDLEGPNLGNLPDPPDLLDLGQDPLEETSSCATCTECANAFSPLGYLFDLLDFIDDQWEVTVDDLERILLQKIKDLDCEQAQSPTTQIRIAIQILEKFIGGQILRNDSDWQTKYRATGDALVQLLSQELELDRPLTNVVGLASDQRFAGNQNAQTLVTALSWPSPALADLDFAEQAMRTIVVADIEVEYPLPQEPPSEASDDQTITYLLERSRQEQSRDIEKQEFENQLAQIVEPTWVSYRDALINKTQKPARELENLLFIHLTAAPCHRTTPITQLILSLQAFVLAVRTGEIAQLKQTPRLAAIIGSNDFSIFDEEIWSWLETYAKWSSAMYAFLYPENLMSLPTLRESMSQGFGEALQALSLSASVEGVNKASEECEKHFSELIMSHVRSSHVVNDVLYIFSEMESTLLLNKVHLHSNTATGWQKIAEVPSGHFVFGVVPIDESFLIGYAREGYDTRKDLRFVVLTRDHTVVDGPRYSLPSPFESIEDLRLVLEYVDNGAVVPRLHVKLKKNDDTYSEYYLIYIGGEFLGLSSPAVPFQHQLPNYAAVGGKYYYFPMSPQEFDNGPVVRGGVTRVPLSNSLLYVTLESGEAHITLHSLASNPFGNDLYGIGIVTWTGVQGEYGVAFVRMNLTNNEGILDTHLLIASEGADRRILAELRQAPNSSLLLSYQNLYSEERNLHFPLLASRALNRSGDYANAHAWLLRLYNPFSLDNSQIFPFSQYFSGASQRPQEWLGDALNPYNIGRQRSGVYLRHVILAMVKNLLDWADHEFTLNNAESLNRAGELYRLAEQILQAPELSNPCQDGLMALEFEIGRRYVLSANNLFTGLDKMAGTPDGKRTIEELLGLVRSGKDLRTVRRTGQGHIDSALKSSSTTKFSSRLEMRERLVESFEYHLLSTRLSLFDPDTTRKSPFIGDWVGSVVAGRSVQTILLQIARNADGSLHGMLMGQRLDELKINQNSALIEFLQTANGISFKGKLQNDEIKGKATSINNRIEKDVTFKRVRPGIDLGDLLDIEIDPVSVTLCIPPNPLLAAFRGHISIGLLALDKCRMISGELQPATRVPPGALQDTVPTILNLVAAGVPLTIANDQPRYRYGYLLEQARQRAALAKQLGDALLGALKERDAAAYDLFLAQNARELAGANRDLKDLVRQEARDAKEVADAHLDRAEANQEFWNDRTANSGRQGLSSDEALAMGLLQQNVMFSYAAAITSLVNAGPAIALGGLGAGTTATGIGAPVGLVALLVAAAAGGSAAATAFQAFAQASAAEANVLLTRASFERRWEEWNLQNTLANHDATIADLQVALAEDRVAISDKDYEIAGLQYTHAQRVYEFLQNKTLNKELYEWMVSVLVEQFRAVMQSAAAVAQLAQKALEFEWQAPVTIIKGDYWTVDAPSLREDQKGYGLLGAERLLTDLTRLDDFRLAADKRRLQLSKTFSLAQRFPSDFVRLQQAGRIELDTLMDWFDEDFPGHYLRLIKSVRVSVLALVPPIDGIHASLTNTGASTVMLPDRPPQRSLRTFGESIALDSPYNESGLFVLDYNDPMLLPFEGLGVETHWVFDLPRASNRFNFDTIADVLITIEYTALHDAAYADRVRQRLGTSRSANSVLSLRTSFPDQWYHLQNPLDGAQTQVVGLNIPRTFFAPNLQNLLLTHLTVILVPADSTPIQTIRNRLPQNGIRITVGGIGVDVSGNLIDQNSGSITTMQPGQPGSGNPPFTDPTFDGQNVAPFGNWEVRFSSELYATDSSNLRPLDLLADVLLVPTVEGNVA